MTYEHKTAFFVVPIEHAYLDGHAVLDRSESEIRPAWIEGDGDRYGLGRRKVLHAIAIEREAGVLVRCSIELECDIATGGISNVNDLLLDSAEHNVIEVNDIIR